MIEEAERLKSDLKHTMSALLGQKVERTKFEIACQLLKASFGGSRTSCGLRRMTWLRPGMGCSLPSMSFKGLGISSLHPGASCGSLKRSYVLPMATCAIR